MPNKDENNGLLSRVVNFVRNPGSSWGSSGNADADHEAQVSKQMLRELIERKRRNDFVRKREFDMLRKLRRSDVLASQEHGSRPSFFHSSIQTKVEDRASTLKKIDDIEAQMSMQWWKANTPEGATVRPPGSGRTPLGSTSQVPLEVPPAMSPTAYVETEPMPFRPDAGDSTVAGPLGPLLAFGLEDQESLGSASPADHRESSANSSMTSDQAPLMNSMNAGLGGSASKNAPLDTRLPGLEVGEEFTHDPELEEAAIRFANGDNAGCAAGLLEVLAPGGPRIDHEETWLALFDLFRATGQHDRFEAAALDFALRFGRSAPQWVSLPEAVGRMNLSPTPPKPAPGVAVADWTSPMNLGLQSVAAMNAALARSPRPWRISWAKLGTIDPAAVEPLRRAFAQWSAQPLPIRFLAVEKLEKVLCDATPSGDATVDAQWWQLRMEMLRLTQQPDEFEMVALDYCVTYEVSPPSWEKSLCDYKALQHDGSPVAVHAIVGDMPPDSVPSSQFLEAGRVGAVGAVELAGEILGDATEALLMLDAKLGSSEVMVISCARLIRIDFSAAGMLLNWVAERSLEGRKVQFTDVHRLVAAFFTVIAIGEHARVTIRAD
jgi:ABC-type transporter Mla MlaB component